ncbi:GntR family transcriptional regulator [Celeribacter sp.]|uniref:GntR family transcriptional regulator n=1 Tax=Celeribacter sp. TaxID=1890673 RepID=UPI003A929CCC
MTLTKRNQLSMANANSTPPEKARRRAPSQSPRGPARFAKSGAQTTADGIYEKLHAAIASMELRPGTPMSETRLTEEFGVSRTPVREALQRLAKEKLVEIVPKSGTFVGRIPLSTLFEATFARSALECAIVRHVAERATPDHVETLRAALDVQRDVASSGDYEKIHVADEAFHAALANVANFEGIWEMVRTMKVQVDRYRKLTLQQSGRVTLLIKEHTEVVDAIEARDPERAVAAMAEHLGRLKLDIEVFGATWKDYFIHDREIGG